MYGDFNTHIPAIFSDHHKFMECKIKKINSMSASICVILEDKMTTNTYYEFIQVVIIILFLSKYYINAK